jgi:hypothetical protein
MPSAGHASAFGGERAASRGPTVDEQYRIWLRVGEPRIHQKKPSSVGIDGIQSEPLNFSTFGYLERESGGWTTAVEESTGTVRIKSAVDSGPGYFEALVSGDSQTLHCTDGRPAYQYYDEEEGGVVQLWFRNGFLESMDGEPAAIYANGTKEWRRKGKLHRDGGEPAIIAPNGDEYFYKNGRLFMSSNDAAGVLRSYGGSRQVLHRADGAPALIGADGRREWWIRGRRHRMDGPAVIRADGTKEWWVKGKRVSAFRFFLITRVSPLTRSRLFKSLVIPKEQGENPEPPD